MDAHCETCANCGTPLAGPYCHACGQKRLAPEERGLRHLAAQLFDALTDFDSRFWRSLRQLMFRPGQLSVDYLAGRRQRHMSPVAIFILANLLYFLFPAFSDFELSFAEQASGSLRIRMLEERGILTEPVRQSLENWNGQLHSPYTSRWVEERIAARDAARRARDPTHGYGVNDYAQAYDQRRGEISRLLIILHVPAIALVLWLLHLRHRLWFAEHFVVALHLFAALVFIAELLVLPLALALGAIGARAALPWMSSLAFLLTIAYFSRALQVVYRRHLVWSLLGALAVLAGMLAFSVIGYRTLQFLIIFAMT